MDACALDRANRGFDEGMIDANGCDLYVELFGLQLLQDRLPYWIPSFGTETKDTLIRIVSRKRRQIHAGNGPQ